MPIPQTDIDDLNAAIALGERLVRKADGSTVEYRSVSDLIRARDYLARLKAEDAAAAAGKPRRRAARLYHAGRGFR
ncbi:phage head-tail joining protein [Thauera sp.]|uniref:phage head-tail joining protein n=1 Tax=Thauera sp. TaxID=1905334 RepID=UPI0039E57F4A